MKRGSKFLNSLARTSCFCLSVVVVLLLCVQAQAEPYLVCDPQSDADGYVYSLNGGVDIEVPYQTAVLGGQTVAVISDLAGLAPGPFTYQVRAFKVSPLWGRMESSTVPFAESKPSVGSPSNLVIAR